MNTELESEVILAIQKGRKIEAIKKLRQKRGIGLKEAKELVDSYCAEHNISTLPVQKVNSSNTLVLIVILSLVGFLLYKYFG